MGILSDAEELAKAFPKASWPTKIIILSGFLGSVTSLASISESVYKWKGFVANFLEIYDKYVKAPFTELLAFLPFQIPTYTLDYLILCICTVIAMYRAIESGNLKHPSYTKKFILIIYLEVLFFFYIGVEDIMDAFSPTVAFAAIIAFGLFLMPLVYWYSLLYGIDFTRKRAEENLAKEASKSAKGKKNTLSPSSKVIKFGEMSKDLVDIKCSWSKYYLQIGLYVLTLLILAGITEGLAKPLT